MRLRHIEKIKKTFVYCTRLAGFLALLIVSGCRRDQGQFDYDQRSNHFLSEFVQTEDAAIFSEGIWLTRSVRRLIYYDKKTGECTPLCGKPECLHDTAECNAWLGDPGSQFGLSLYGHKLIWVQYNYSKRYYEIITCRTDGTGRKALRKIDSPDMVFPEGDRIVLFHRGFLFVCGSNLRIEDAKTTAEYQVQAFSLSDGGKDEILFDEHLENTGDTSSVGILRMTAKDDFLYWFYSEKTDTSVYSESQLKIYRQNLSDHKTECVFDGTVPFVTNEVFAETDRLLMTAMRENALYSLDIKTGSIKKAFTVDQGSEKSAASLNFGDGYMIGYSIPNPNDPGHNRLCITDMYGKILRDEILEDLFYREPNGLTGRALLGCDSDSAYYALLPSDTEKRIPDEYFIRVKTAGGEPEIIWRSGEGLETASEDERSAAEDANEEAKDTGSPLSLEISPADYDGAYGDAVSLWISFYNSGDEFLENIKCYVTLFYDDAETGEETLWLTQDLLGPGVKKDAAGFSYIHLLKDEELQYEKIRILFRIEAEPRNHDVQEKVAAEAEWMQEMK